MAGFRNTALALMAQFQQNEEVQGGSRGNSWVPTDGDRDIMALNVSLLTGKASHPPEAGNHTYPDFLKNIFSSWKFLGYN